jgi:hypothetical protein
VGLSDVQESIMQGIKRRGSFVDNGMFDEFDQEQMNDELIAL